MNCHHHDFVGLGLGSAHPRNQGMSEIAIQHNVNQPLTTSYGLTSPETSQQKQKRLTQAAMAKAQAVTRYYGGTPNPNPPVEEPTRRRSTISEPGYLALNPSFRVSNSSLLSIEDNLSGGSGSNHSSNSKAPIHSTPIPPPPPLKTEVTNLLMNPSQPVLNAEVVATSTLKPPPAPHRPSSSSRSRSPPRQQYKGRSSFQAHEPSLTPPVLPKKPAPALYPSVAVAPAVTHSYRTSTNSEGGGLLRGLAIEEQAQMLKRYQEEQSGVSTHAHPTTTTPIACSSSSSATEDSRTLAVEEQEQLWQQFSSNTYHSISPNTTPAAARALSPQEEQAKLWDQLAATRNRQRRDPLEEQAQLLQAFKRTATPQLSAVEEQERMLRQTKNKRAANPIEEQAQRLREIQDAKEKRIMEMACQLSTTAPDRDGEEELSLEYIMELSRREAEDHTRAQQDLERAVLQEALQRSKDDLGCSFSLGERLRQHEQSVDFELRRSIAELACQTSERTVGSNPRVGVSSYR